MTVSYVLNDRSGKVGVETRERVNRVMKEMHYRPSAVARGLSRQRLNAIGVIFHVRASTKLVATPYFGDILGGILEMSMTREQSATLFTEMGDTETQRRLNIYCDGRCDGLIFVAPRDRANLVTSLRNLQVPHVFVSDNGDDPQTSYIDVDNVAAAKQAVDYLIGFGHTRIAHLCGDEAHSSAHRRREGYIEALHQAGIPIDDSLVLGGIYSSQSGHERTSTLLARGAQAPTAIFCSSDEIAIGALDAAHKLGFSIPGDISIIGFDDTSGADSAYPPLTTMRQPLHQIGSEAVEILLDMIDDGGLIGRKRILQAELIERSTVGPPPSAAVMARRESGPEVDN
jgi:DNA-binding LacI/PurR family transcriptional regulator